MKLFWFLVGMEGGACTPDPEVSAKILNLLTEVGLISARLAVSHGSEESLARQLAERLGLECKPWHVSFVKGQVREAVQMADLDNRVRGTSSSWSMQNLVDAKAMIEKEKKPLEPQADVLVLPAIPKRGTLGRTVRLRGGRIAAENEVNDKVLCKLVDELKIYGAVVLEEVAKAMNPMRAGKIQVVHDPEVLPIWLHGSASEYGPSPWASRGRDRTL